MSHPRELEEAFEYIKKDLVWLEGFISNSVNDESRKLAVKRIDIIRKNLKLLKPLEYEIHPATREALVDVDVEDLCNRYGDSMGIPPLGNFFLPGQQ